MKTVLLSVLALLAIKGSVSVNTFESVPPTSESGVLTACVGQQISLICSHNNILTGGTRWIAGPPINCETDIGHIGANPPLPDPCGPFTFQEITPQSPLPPVLNSTVTATAAVNMTDTNIECRGGSVAGSFSVGNISLCIANQPPPPIGLRCENISNGLNVSWEAFSDTSCAMSDIEYLITVIREHDTVMIFPIMTTRENSTELTDTQVLQPETTYIVTVRARIEVDSCISENATTACKTSPSLPTQPPSPQAESSQNPTSSSGPSSAPLSTGSIVGIVLGSVVVVVAGFVIVMVIIIIIKKSSRDGKNGTDQGVHAPLADDTEQQQLAVYAMVDKSKKISAEQPTYQDPNSIKHEQAPTGDEYAMPQQTGKRKGKSQGSSVDPESVDIAAMYSTVDTSKKNQLTYAQLDVGSGSGGIPAQQSTSYATVVK